MTTAPDYRLREEPKPALLREHARLGGGDRVRLRDGRTGRIEMITYLLYSGEPPKYGISIDGEEYTAYPHYDRDIPESDIVEQLSIGRHTYRKPETRERRRRNGEIIPPEPRGICQRCGLKKSEAHKGE